MNPLKELSLKTGGKIKKEDLFHPNFPQQSARVLVIKDYRHCHVQIHDHVSLYGIQIKQESEIAFSINKPHIVLNCRTLVETGILYPVYVSDADAGVVNDASFLKACTSIGGFLESIDLRADEAVFVSRNRISFALQTSRRLSTILDGIVDLMNNNQEIFKRTSQQVISVKEFPENLQGLAPLLKSTLYRMMQNAQR